MYDSNYNFLGYSDYYYSDTETISLVGLKAGTYYAQVYSYVGNTNDYTPVINAPGTTTNINSDRFESNNTLSTAKDLGTIKGSSSIPYLSIGNSDVDWFKFKLDSTGIKENFVAIAFDTYQGDLDLRLYNSSGTLLKSATGVRNAEQLNLEGLAAGNYYVEIKGYNGATNGNYSLIFDAPGDPYEANNGNDSKEKANNLGQITGIRTFDNLSVKQGDDDWFRFRLTSTGTQENFIRLDFLHELGNIDFALYQNTNGGGSSNPSLTNSSINLVLKQSATGKKNGEEISLEGLSAGEYFIKIYNNNNTNNTYNLIINAANTDEFEGSGGNNTRQTATNLNNNQRIQAQGYIDNTEIPLSIHQANDEDWYKFTLSSETPKDGDFIAIILNTTQGDIDLELYNSSGNKLTGSYGFSNTQRKET